MTFFSCHVLNRLIRKFKGSLDVCTAFPNVSLLAKAELTRSESLQDWYHNLPDDKTTDITPLIFTILMNNFEGCKFLLQKGASPNAKDRDGMTSLMHAVKQVHIVSAIANAKILRVHDTASAIWERAP